MPQPSAKLLLAISVLSLSFAVAIPAAAQPYPYPPARYGGMHPEDVMERVRAMGLTPSSARIRGGVWVVHAFGRDGTPVRVVVDRWSGRVVEILRVGPRPPEVARVVPPGRAFPGESFDDDERMVPPAAIPRGRPYPGPPVGIPDEDDDDEPPFVGRRPSDDISSSELPPPGAGPRVITRDGDVTHSVPPRSAGSPPQAVDPLLGVPPEFRGGKARTEPSPQPKRAAKEPADRPAARTTPLPPRRPETPAVARRDEPPAVEKPAPAESKKGGEAKAKEPETKSSQAPAPAPATPPQAAQPRSGHWPPVQPLE